MDFHLSFQHVTDDRLRQVEETSRIYICPEFQPWAFCDRLEGKLRLHWKWPRGCLAFQTLFNDKAINVVAEEPKEFSQWEWWEIGRVEVIIRVLESR